MRNQTIYDLGQRKALLLAFRKPCEDDVDVFTLRTRGIDAYFVVKSENDINEIMSVADDIIHSSTGTIDLNINDVKSILHDANRAYYSCGVGSGASALKDALDEVKEDFSRCGVNIFETKKFLFRICMPIPKVYDREYVMEQMNAFVEFQSLLPDNYDLKFCLMPVEGQKTTVSAFVVKA